MEHWNILATVAGMLLSLKVQLREGFEKKESESKRKRNCNRDKGFEWMVEHRNILGTVAGMHLKCTALPTTHCVPPKCLKYQGVL